MAMTLDEILQSGILELYVLGQLTEQEIQEVESAMKRYPQLKSEVVEIEQALFKYDGLFKTPPPAGTLDSILAQTNTTNNKDVNTQKGGFNWSGIVSAILGFSLLASVFFYHQKTNELENTIDDQKVLIQECGTVTHA